MTYVPNLPNNNFLWWKWTCEWEGGKSGVCQICDSTHEAWCTDPQKGQDEVDWTWNDSTCSCTCPSHASFDWWNCVCDNGYESDWSKCIANPQCGSAYHKSTSTTPSGTAACSLGSSLVGSVSENRTDHWYRWKCKVDNVTVDCRACFGNHKVNGDVCGCIGTTKRQNCVDPQKGQDEVDWTWNYENCTCTCPTGASLDSFWVCHMPDIQDDDFPGCWVNDVVTDYWWTQCFQDPYWDYNCTCYMDGTCCCNWWTYDCNTPRW